MFKRGTPHNPSVFGAAPVRLVPEEVLECLEEGDRCENGRILDKDGNEVPVKATNGAHGH